MKNGNSFDSKYCFIQASLENHMSNQSSLSFMKCMCSNIHVKGHAVHPLNHSSRLALIIDEEGITASSECSFLIINPQTIDLLCNKCQNYFRIHILQSKARVTDLSHAHSHHQTKFPQCSFDKHLTQSIPSQLNQFIILDEKSDYSNRSCLQLVASSNELNLNDDLDLMFNAGNQKIVVGSLTNQWLVESVLESYDIPVELSY
jgi:hypothetical protein